MKKEATIKLRIWVERGDLPFLGPGRVELLQNIKKFGSISKAAAEVKMSYRKAWQLIKDMNSIAKSELVVKRVGGTEGGGAELTKEGLKLVKSYEKVSENINNFVLKNNTLFDF